MRASRWLRRRYYPIFLEEIYKPLSSSLAFVNVGGLTRELRSFSSVNILVDWLLQPREFITHAISIPLQTCYLSVIYSQAQNIIHCLPVSDRSAISRYYHILSLKSEAREQPFLVLLQPAFSFNDIERSYFTFKFSSSFITQEATPAVYERLILQHQPSILSGVESSYTDFLVPTVSLLIGLTFPLCILGWTAFFSKIDSYPTLFLSPDFPFVSAPRNQISLPFYHCFALRSAKYTREDESDITPFLEPFKLGLTFIYPILLETSLRNINNLFALRTKLIGFKIHERLRTPDIIFLTLRLGTSYISSPEIISLRISPEFDYDLQSVVRLDRNLNLFLVGKLEKNFLGLLKLIISDASGEFLLDIAKSIFDVIEAYILQPGVLKFSL